jgi:tripartite-type tricarboxylate transporter receptor subunit TctC
VPRIARAQAYPSRPVRIIVGFAAGSSPDIVARLMGQWLSERLGWQFIIDNRPGAGTNIATEAVANAAPDGYTLLYATASSAINATLYEKLNFNFIRDISPVAGIVRVPNVIVVHPSVPARTVPEFIAYAKANPGKLNMATAGIGGTDHVSGELFKMMTGVNIVHVPYRGGGGPLFADLLSGQVQVAFGVVVASLAHIRTGKLHPLAVTTATRSEVLPDIPTVGEFVPGYEASAWHGLCVHKNTQAAIIDRLNNEINAGLADPKLKARLADVGGSPMMMTPAGFGKFIADETEKWGKVVKFAGIKAE